MSKKLSLLAVIFAFVFLITNGEKLWRQFNGGAATSIGSDDVFAAAYEARRSSFVAEGAGTVLRILSDDNDGSRHQRFILELNSGQTLLIAHNIDLAPRIETLSIGDQVSFKGEYEWSDKGGTVHWTHHDPAGRHEGGWLRHEGRTYE